MLNFRKIPVKLSSTDSGSLKCTSSTLLRNSQLAEPICSTEADPVPLSLSSSMISATRPMSATAGLLCHAKEADTRLRCRRTTSRTIRRSISALSMLVVRSIKRRPSQRSKMRILRPGSCETRSCSDRTESSPAGSQSRGPSVTLRRKGPSTWATRRSSLPLQT